MPCLRTCSHSLIAVLLALHVAAVAPSSIHKHVRHHNTTNTTNMSPKKKQQRRALTEGDA
jgi:hypothetical protein